MGRDGQVRIGHKCMACMRQKGIDSVNKGQQHESGQKPVFCAQATQPPVEPLFSPKHALLVPTPTPTPQTPLAA
ncbi:unnamed protein product [Protopolystoma xenopodis]|uniref:Uncharacterized protein n=1 Tax=Protopolystoma xenopodis TaxID=117903 RepID=A0A448XLQ5_9PLAT|nr:unnamed protein product [Protopolystoma xenopodis]